MKGKVGLAWFALLLALPATAHSQPPPAQLESLEWLTADSDAVVRGRIVSISHDRDRDTTGGWETVSFQADETLKGPALQSFRFAARSAGMEKALASWAKDRSPLLLYLVESRRIGDRHASRFRFSPRIGYGRLCFVELTPTAAPQAMTTRLETPVGPALLESPNKPSRRRAPADTCLNACRSPLKRSRRRWRTALMVGLTCLSRKPYRRMRLLAGPADALPPERGVRRAGDPRRPRSRRLHLGRDNGPACPEVLGEPRGHPGGRAQPGRRARADRIGPSGHLQTAVERQRHPVVVRRDRRGREGLWAA